MDWAAFLKAHDLEHSMSRRGNCHDNAVAESFFNLLKRERIDLLPAGPSVITRVCGFEIGSWTGRFGQARLAWSLQIAQAPGALPAASGSRVRSAA